MPEPTDDERKLAQVEPAWGTCAYGLRTGFRVGHHRDLRCQPLVNVHEDLERYRELAEGGETLHLLHAVKRCAQENLPLPSWLAAAFTAALDGFSAGRKAWTLDQAFKSSTLPTNTEKRAAKARQDWALGSELWQAVRAIARQHSGMDSAIEAVLKAGKGGARWGPGKTRARQLVEMVDHTQSTLTSRRIKPLSALWAKPRNGSP